MTGPATIAANLARIRERIARAAEGSGRSPQEVTLIAVSKTFPAQAIREAYAAGVRHFGENRVQEWESKQPLLVDLEATWHLVGHLQSNKARRAACLFQAIDSVDSLPLAQKLDRAFEQLCYPVGARHAMPLQAPPRRLRVLIEVRVAPEESKSGAEESDLPALAEALLALPHLDFRGLMAIPPLTDDPQQARPYFRKLRELRDSLQHQLDLPPLELSMGMSHDCEVAIEEGATQVRLGTALFGPRS